MSDQLAEAIDSYRSDVAKQWLAENPRVEVLLAAARAHLGCSTITDEQVEAGAVAAYRVEYGRDAELPDDEAAYYQRIAHWVLEAAARVGTEKQK